METLAQAKIDIRQGWRTPDGADCPCCGQKVKLYRRNIYAGMAAQLIKLYRLGDGYYHMSQIGTTATGGGDFAKLRYWGLIEEDENNDDPEKRTSGLWRITEQGRLFALGASRVMKYALIFNKRCYGFEGEKQSIKDALGKKFDYAELMGRLL